MFSKQKPMPELLKTLQTYFGSTIQLKDSTVVFWINAFIPKNTTNCEIVPEGAYKGKSMMLGPAPWNGHFLTDSREFSSNPSASVRLQSLLLIDNLNHEFKWWQHHRADETVELNGKTGKVTCTKRANISNMSFKLKEITMTSISFELNVGACNPCLEGSPDLRYKADELCINFKENQLKFNGAVSSYPSFEAYVQQGNCTRVTLFQQHHEPGATPWSLFAGANRSIKLGAYFGNDLKKIQKSVLEEQAKN